MLRYILSAIIIYKLIKGNNLIEGTEGKCCENQIPEVTRHFHNSSCVYSRGQDGEKKINGAPEIIQRCMKESDRERPFNCEGIDDNCDSTNNSECVGCNNICPDEELNDCVPTIVRSNDGYEEGGYCKNNECSDKNEDDCRKTTTCKWNGKLCESKKFIYKDEEKKELKKKVGTLLNYSNSERYKKYANLKCNPFSHTTRKGGILGDEYEAGTHDGPFSDIKSKDLMPSWLEDLILFLVISFFVFLVNYLFKNNMKIKTFFKGLKTKMTSKTNLKGKVNLKKGSSTLGSSSSSSLGSSSSSSTLGSSSSST